MSEYEFDQYRQQLTYNWQLEDQLNTVWVQLKPYKDDCCFIYAGLNSDYTILLRSDEHVINQINDAVLAGKHNIIFDCSTEGLDDRIVPKLNSIATTARSLFADIELFLITGASDGEDAYATGCEHLMLKPALHVISCRFFEFVAKSQYLTDFAPTDYTVMTRPKTYVCLNKVLRSHRVKLLDSLLGENLVNNDCYYSFYDSLSPLDTEPALQHAIGMGYLPEIKNNIDLVKTLRLNFDENRTNPIDIIPTDMPLFTDTYFSLVTETMYYDRINPKFKIGYPLPFLNCIFFSEKVYKPIAMMHPFIVVARPHSIRMLNEHGYKTFHPYIDESYDSIEDDHDRMQAVIKEVKRLSKQTPDEWLQWCANIKSIVEHNQKQLRENTRYIDDKDLVRLNRIK